MHMATGASNLGYKTPSSVGVLGYPFTMTRPVQATDYGLQT
jgi:hypothetical protein